MATQLGSPALQNLAVTKVEYSGGGGGGGNLKTRVFSELCFLLNLQANLWVLMGDNLPFNLVNVFKIYISKDINILQNFDEKCLFTEYGHKMSLLPR